jgi:hypothetical protein
LWWTKWRRGRFSPSTSVSPAIHSTKFSIFTITRDRYNRPVSGRRAERTQFGLHYATADHENCPWQTCNVRIKIQLLSYLVGFEVLTAVVMNIMLRSMLKVSRRFGRTFEALVDFQLTVRCYSVSSRSSSYARIKSVRILVIYVIYYVVSW